MGIFIVLLASCAKDSATKELTAENAQIETRTGGCEPQLRPYCDPYIRNFTVQHPLFPGCSFNVEAKLVKCTKPYLASFYDFKVISHNCPQYELYISNCNLLGNMNSCIIAINEGLQDAMAVQEILVYDAPFTPTLATVQFYFASCSQYCYFQDYSEELGTSFLNYRSMPCTDGCCLRSSTYQSQEVGLVIIKSTTEQISGNGCDNIIQSFPCPANSTITTTCILECM